MRHLGGSLAPLISVPSTCVRGSAACFRKLPSAGCPHFFSSLPTLKVRAGSSPYCHLHFFALRNCPDARRFHCPGKQSVWARAHLSRGAALHRSSPCTWAFLEAGLSPSPQMPFPLSLVPWPPASPHPKVTFSLRALSCTQLGLARRPVSSQGSLALTVHSSLRSASVPPAGRAGQRQGPPWVGHPGAALTCALVTGAAVRSPRPPATPAALWRRLTRLGLRSLGPQLPGRPGGGGEHRAEELGPWRAPAIPSEFPSSQKYPKVSLREKSFLNFIFFFYPKFSPRLKRIYFKGKLFYFYLTACNGFVITKRLPPCLLSDIFSWKNSNI